MGNESSKKRYDTAPSYAYPFPSQQTIQRYDQHGQQVSSSTFRFKSIADNYTTLDGVIQALREQGLESSNLIVAIDFTKSNEWTGKRCLGGKSLHYIGEQPNPYELVITSIAKTLRSFDDDGLIPAYGFGDVYTQDKSVFSLYPNNQPCPSLDRLVWRYRELVPYVRLAGPTSFAPAIYQAMDIVARSGGQFHILLLVADGQVTRPSDLEHGQFSEQEQATIQAIVAASEVPLSIIMVGVGDGPWQMMKEFDDALPERKFDNFQFVNFTEIQEVITATYGHDAARKEALFALRALMEVPEQYKLIQRLGLLSKSSNYRSPMRPLDPPGPPPAAMDAPTAAPAAAAPAAGASAGPSAASSAGRGAAAGAVDPLFICPITQEVMVEPVIAADGYSYEKVAIEQWFTRHDTSPMTNSKVQHKMLIPNHALRSAILEDQQRRGAAAR